MRAGAGAAADKGWWGAGALRRGRGTLNWSLAPSLGQGEGEGEGVTLGPRQVLPSSALLGHKSEITGSAFRCLLWLDFNNPVLTLYCTAQCTLAQAAIGFP